MEDLELFSFMKQAPVDPLLIWQDCTEKIGSREVARICKNRFSNQERPCNGELVRRVELINKNIIFYPNRVYCYMPLCRYLANLVNRPGFDALCN